MTNKWSFSNLASTEVTGLSNLSPSFQFSFPFSKTFFFPSVFRYSSHRFTHCHLTERRKQQTTSHHIYHFLHLIWLMELSRMLFEHIISYRVFLLLLLFHPIFYFEEGLYLQTSVSRFLVYWHSTNFQCFLFQTF